MRRSHWAPQNLSDMTERKCMEGQSCTLPVSPWDKQAGQGEWGGRLPALFAPSAPSRRAELCRTAIHRAAHGNEEGDRGQHLPYLQHASDLCWFEINRRRWWETCVTWKHSHFAWTTQGVQHRRHTVGHCRLQANDTTPCELSKILTLHLPLGRGGRHNPACI